MGAQGWLGGQPGSCTIGSETLNIQWQYSIGNGPFQPLGTSENPVFRCYPDGPQHVGYFRDYQPTAKRMKWLVQTVNGLYAYKDAGMAIAIAIAENKVFGAAANNPFPPPTYWGFLDPPPSGQESWFIECVLGRDIAYQAAAMLGISSGDLGKEAAWASTDTVTGRPYQSDVTDVELEWYWWGKQLRFSMNGPAGGWSPAENCFTVRWLGDIHYISVWPPKGPFEGEGDTEAERRKHGLYQVLKSIKDHSPQYLQRWCDGDGVGNDAPTLP